MPAVRQRHALVGTDIAEGERATAAVPSEDERGVEQCDLHQLAQADLASEQGAVPEAEQHVGCGDLPLGLVAFRCQRLGGD